MSFGYFRQSLPPVSITARQLPGVRKNFVDAVVANRGKWDSAPDLALVGSIIEKISAAPLYFVDEAFCELTAAAAASMPMHALTELDPPSASGFVMVEKPVDTQKEIKVRFDAVAGWVWTSSSSGLLVGPIVDGRITWPDRFRWDCRYITTDLVHVPWGSEISVSPVQSSETHWAHPSLVTFWNLLRQESVCQQEDHGLPRAERRRLLKEGRAVPSVRLIYLRQRSSGVANSAGETEWRHRWIVRGHWRRQWYPKLQDHRPVWIAPHIKGPEGAPLLGGEKVYVADAVTASGAVGGDS